jgi:peptide/nickel transport system substrate-binding protein
MVVVSLAVVLLMLSACGGDETTTTVSNAATTSTVPAAVELAVITPPGSGPVPAVLWAVYREPYTLDPLSVFDYPENTAATLMYESLLRMAPDGSIGPGLATLSQPDPKTMIFTINAKAKFWDGNPVTPDDVVFTLQRQADPSLGGFYSLYFDRVDSIAATGADQVTVTLKEPDYWLAGELAGVAGMVVEKSFVEKAGKDFGSPASGAMGTGAYKYDSWESGAGVTVVANPDYWNPAVKPMVQKITVKGVPTAASLASGLVTGAINGNYMNDLSMLPQLEKSPEVAIYRGPSWATDFLLIGNLKGALGDVRVRQALSLAVDRQAMIDTVYRGAAELPRWLTNPGNFSYGRDVFAAAYEKSPLMTQDLEKAKSLVQAAGAVGQPIVIGMSNEVPSISGCAEAWRTAAEAIGLKPTFKAFPIQDYGLLFVDPAAREGVDCWITLNYGDYADPAALLSQFAMPTGPQNFGGYSNAEIISLLMQARSTADPNQRADFVAKAEAIAAEDLPWIPSVQPLNVLVMSKSLTGALASFAYMSAPWADTLGAAQ